MANGLINLQTDLKSLRYGSDKPYVTKDINNPPSSNQTGMQITKRVDDLSRISQMLVDKPGLKFLGNQALLQQVDIQDKLQKSRDGGRTLGGAILQQALGTVKQTAQILGSTLAQVPVNGTGTHFVYAFRTDTYLQPSGGNIRSGFAQFFGAGGVEGAPLALKGQEITGEVVSKFGQEINDGDFKVTRESQYDYDNSINSPQQNRGAKTQAQAGQPIYSGPLKIVNIPFAGQAIPVIIPVGARETTAISGSLGISNQNITGSTTNPADELGILPPTQSKYKDTEQYLSNKSYSTGVNGDFNAENSAKTDNSNFYSTDNIVSRETNLGTAFTTADLENIKPVTPEQVDRDNPTNTYSQKQAKRPLGNSTRDVRKEQRINLGNQGKKISTVNYAAPTDPDVQDKLNALDIQTSRPDGINEARDLAKFFFEVITPESSTFLNFRAFITSLDDSYNANWEGKRYVGRADEFYTYGGFSRDINIGFRIAAATRSELRPLYRKMVYLASTTAPTYGEFKFMRGTVVRLSLGSYFNEIPGVLTSVKYTWNVDYPWEIALSDPEGGETGVQELPMVMDCSISFKPIHDFVPQTGLYHYITSKEQSKSFF